MFVPIKEALKDYHSEDIPPALQHERKRKNKRHRDPYGLPDDELDEGREYFSMTTANDPLSRMHHPLLSNEMFFELTQH